MGADPLFIAVAIAAVFIVALAKSGLVSSLGVAGVPILTLVMPPKEAAAFMLPALLLMDVIAVWAWRHEISWPNIAILVPGAVVFLPLGATLEIANLDEQAPLRYLIIKAQG